MTLALGLTSIGLYLTATVLLGLRAFSAQFAGAPVRNSQLGATILAVCLHALVLYQGLFTGAGLNLSFFNAASLVTWVIAAFLVIALIGRSLDNIGIFVLPLAALAVLLSLSFQGEHLVSGDAGPGIRVHVVVSILAYSILAVAAFQALLLAYQERLLRVRRSGRFQHLLPPLQTQETLLFQMIGFGFFLLSLSLVSGIVFVQDMMAQHLAHKTVLSAIAWCVFALLLWGRWRHGWRGRTAIRWSLAGFVALMLAYFGSKLVLELVLHRAWY